MNTYLVSDGWDEPALDFRAGCSGSPHVARSLMLWLLQCMHARVSPGFTALCQVDLLAAYHTDLSWLHWLTGTQKYYRMMLRMNGTPLVRHKIPDLRDWL